jgi:Zn-finger nucleic acid-binding protein
VCDELMVRWNFGRSSGVLVDVCRKHGVWFDAEELAHVLRWIRSGNLHAAQGDLARMRRSTLKTAPPTKQAAADQFIFSSLDDRDSLTDDPINLVVEAVADVIGTWFGIKR